MSDRNWFRRKSWTERDRTEFFARLNKTKTPFNKAQYLRIQASYFLRDVDPPNVLAALELLDYFLKECPEPAELPAAFVERANCFEKLGRPDDAIESYREGVRLQQDPRAMKTNVVLVFGMFVVKNRLRDHYDEILNLLQRDADSTLVPMIGRYQACSIMAIVAHELGKTKEANKYAIEALKAAEVEGGIGLESDTFRTQIEALARGLYTHTRK